MGERKEIIMQDEIISISKKIMEQRKFPLLILVLDYIKLVNYFDVYEELKGQSFKTIDVILQTTGGTINPAFQIIKMLRRHAEKVNIIVPWLAKSAGTLICLGADKILMTELSELGPLDSQISEEHEEDRSKTTSALNGFNALEQIREHAIETLDMTTKLIFNRSRMKTSRAFQLASEFSAKTCSPLYNQLDPKQIGLCARALDLGEKYGKTILTGDMKWDKEKARRTVERLVWDYPDHDFVIDLDELKELELPAILIDNKLTKTLDDMRESLIKAYIKNVSVIKLIKHNNKSKEQKNEKQETTSK